jgi:uncharacterized protein
MRQCAPLRDLADDIIISADALQGEILATYYRCASIEGGIMPDSKGDRSGGVRPYPALSRPMVGVGGRSVLGPSPGPGSLVTRMILLVLVSAAAVYSILSGYMALTLTLPSRLPFERSPDEYGLAFEAVTFPSRVDSITLDGWLLPVAGSTRRPVVMVHGKGSDRQREVDGHALEIARALVQDGHPVLMFDLRGSGLSGGDRFTLGAKEVRDVGGAVDFLESRGLAAQGVDLLGYSMGAATSMLVAASEPKVSAVAEDSGYADLGGVLEDQVPKVSGLPSFFTPGVILAARVLVGVDAYSIRPIDGMQALAARGVPLLVIHGEADGTVPVSHGRRLVTAYGPKAESYFVPGAEHVGSYAANPSAYLARLTAFLDRIE